MHESEFEVLIDSINKLQGNCFLPRFYLTFQSQCIWRLGSSSAFREFYFLLSLKLAKLSQNVRFELI